MFDNIENLSEKVIQLWCSNDTITNVGATIEQFQIFERETSISLPTDLKTFYSKVNGMRDHEDDKTYFSFWSLERIMKEKGFRKTIKGGSVNVEIDFGDFLIDSHFYTLKLQDSAEVGVYITDGETAIKVTNTFSDFLKVYLNNPDQLEMFRRQKSAG